MLPPRSRLFGAHPVAELKKLEKGAPTQMIVDDKAKIGMAWLPSFARQFSDRLGRATIDKPTHAKKTGPQLFEEQTRIAARLKELKEEIQTFENLAKLGSARWRIMVGELAIKGRSSLRITMEPLMVNKLAEVLGLASGAVVTGRH